MWWHTRLALLALLLLALAAVPAASQGPDTPVSSEDVMRTPAVGLDQPATAPAGAEPALLERAAPPRTLRAYWHVFLAFALTWILLFGYVLSLGWRLGSLERDLAALHRGVPVE